MTTTAYRGSQGGKKTPPGGGPGYGPQATLNRPTNPNTLTDRQAQGNYNYSQAMAFAQGDPRYAGKQYQRPGMSSSQGTAYLGAGQAANQYSQGMAAAEAGRMQDAYANANTRLDDATQRSEFSQALLRQQQGMAQAEYMNQLRNQQNAMNFMGGMISPFGGGSNLLAGLL